MSILLLKSIFSIVMVILAVIAMFTMFEIFERDGKRYNIIRNPYKDMPSFSYLPDKDVLNLIAFLNTL